MSRIGPWLGVCALAVLLAPSAPAQPLGTFLDLGVASATPSGDAAYRSPVGGGLIGARTPVDTEYRLEALPSIRWIGPKYRLEASYRQSAFWGTTTFADIPALRSATAATAPFSTHLDVDHFSAGVRANVLDRPTFTLGVGADIDRLQVRTFLQSPFPDFDERSESRVFGAPVATAGFNFHDAARRAFFDVKVGYSNFAGSELEKARLEAGWGFAKHAGIKAGWEGLRYLDDGSAATPRTDLRLSTFTGGFFFSF